MTWVYRHDAALRLPYQDIPAIREQMILIQEIQTDEWWQDVTTPMLETARRKLRALVKLIEKQQRKPVFTDFEDVIGDENPIGLTQFTAADGYERFRDKARVFLRAHLNNLAVQKLHLNQPLTPLDLQELERVLADAGGNPELVQRARMESSGLGHFVRSLVGLDREAAKQALGALTAGSRLSASQIEFLNLVVDHLTEHGAMSPALLYESPFTDVNARGPEGLFTAEQIGELIVLLQVVRSRAEA